MSTKKPGPAPIDNPQKSRTLRLDDERWKFFREHLGSVWLRAKVDIERKRHAKQTQSDQQE